MLNIGILKKSNSYILISILVITLLIFSNGLIDQRKQLMTNLNDEMPEINKLIISEVMASNKGSFIDEEGNLFDFIELYNGTFNDINLLNYGLSDREDGKVKWLFPDISIKSKSYLIVYLIGEEKDGLYANFSLKKEGNEIVSLKKPNGKVIDTLKTVEMKNNESMSRMANGDWVVTNEITPGFENTTNGRSNYLYSYKNNKDKNNDLIISEILPSNEGNILIDDGLYGYIEITNNGDETINLNSYYLSNEESILYKYRLGDVMLKPNSSITYYENDPELFKIKHKNGKIYLTNKYGIVDEVTYSNLKNGLAYIKFDDIWYQSANISPGENNTTSGKIQFQEKIDIAPNDLIISEVMSSNNSILPMNGNKYYDWIELYNNSSGAINLKDYVLSNNKDDNSMYKLPNKTLNRGEYYILIASGDTSLSDEAYEHTNFRLSSGEGLILFKEEKVIDSLFIHNIPKGNSYGRDKKYGHFFYQVPTPNSDNSINNIREISNLPLFSKEGGIYNGIDMLELEINASGDIYYTMDGTIPTNNSSRYEKPIKIDKTTVVKVVVYENGKKNSEVITASYIVNENHTLPVTSISLNKDELKRLKSNIWGNEVINANIEFYDKSSSFALNCGFKLFGGESRQYNKKSYALKFNKNYDGKLNYKVFDNKNITEFSSLVLRSGSQEQSASMIRDELISTIAVNYMDLDAQAAKPTVLYINGEYEGVYFIREKINASFIESNHNIKGNTNLLNAFNYQIEEGSSDIFWKLRNYSNSHDLSTDEAYEYIDKILDIDNFIDYYIMQYTICNYDLQNIRMYNNDKLKNGKIRMILYDTDYGLRTDTGAYFMDYMLDPYYLNPKPDMSTLKGLLKNEKFKKKFINRMNYFIKNAWNEKNINETFDELYNSIEPEMKRNADRWGYNYNTFVRSAESVKKEALRKINKMPQYTKTYFGLSNEEYHEYFG